MKISVFLRGAGILAGALLCAPALAGDELPPDALVDRNTRNLTVYPVVTPDSGKLSYASHRRDLSKWPTLSYDDQRPTPRPQRVSLTEPLNGDVARGKDIAMNTQKGNCWACHALPGDPQPGTGGPSLLGFKSRGYSDAQVYQQVYDARIGNAHTLMPPFGSFGTLSEQDIRDLTAFLQNIQ